MVRKRLRNFQVGGLLFTAGLLIIAMTSYFRHDTDTAIQQPVQPDLARLQDQDSDQDQDRRRRLHHQQQMRRDRVKQVCRQIGRQTELRTSTIRHIHRFFGNWKVGNTNIRHYLIQLSQNASASYKYDPVAACIVHFTNFSSPHLIPIGKYPFGQVVDILHNYNKIMFVRDPIERVVSAWKDKFSRPYNASRGKWMKTVAQWGSQILRAVRPNATEKQLKLGVPIALIEFFQFLKKVHSSKYLNPHWRPYVHNCLPCELNYDYIGRLEEMAEEMEAFARDITQLATVPKLPMPADAYADKRSAIEDLPPELVRQVVEKLYQVDYNMFGYSLPFSDPLPLVETQSAALSAY